MMQSLAETDRAVVCCRARECKEEFDACVWLRTNSPEFTPCSAVEVDCRQKRTRMEEDREQAHKRLFMERKKKLEV